MVASKAQSLIILEKSLKEFLEDDLHFKKKLEEELSTLKDELMNTYDSYVEQVLFLYLEPCLSQMYSKWFNGKWVKEELYVPIHENPGLSPDKDTLIEREGDKVVTYETLMDDIYLQEITSKERPS